MDLASIEDIQELFFATGMIKKKFAGGRLVDGSFADYVAAKLGPFALVNRDSKKAGCR